MFEHEHSIPPEGEPKVDRSGIEFQCLDFCPICRTADVVRATMPEEFRDHVGVVAQHQVCRDTSFEHVQAPLLIDGCLVTE